MQFWDALTGRPSKPTIVIGHEMDPVAFSLDRQWLASASRTSFLLADAVTGQLVRPPTPLSGGANAVAFTPDSATLLTADLQGVQAGDRATGQRRGQPLATQEARIFGLDVSPDARLFPTRHSRNQKEVSKDGIRPPEWLVSPGHWRKAAPQQLQRP